MARVAAVAGAHRGASSEVGEQAESLGAGFLRIEVEDEGPSATGYAKEIRRDFNGNAPELYAEHAMEVDIVITTTALTRARAPRSLIEEMVANGLPRTSRMRGPRIGAPRRGARDLNRSSAVAGERPPPARRACL